MITRIEVDYGMPGYPVFMNIKSANEIMQKVIAQIRKYHGDGHIVFFGRGTSGNTMGVLGALQDPLVTYCHIAKPGEHSHRGDVSEISTANLLLGTPNASSWIIDDFVATGTTIGEIIIALNQQIDKNLLDPKRVLTGLFVEGGSRIVADSFEKMAKFDIGTWYY